MDKTLIYFDKCFNLTPSLPSFSVGSLCESDSYRYMDNGRIFIITKDGQEIIAPADKVIIIREYEKKAGKTK